MKKYGIYLLLVIVTSIACFFAEYWVTKQSIRIESAIPNTTYETGTVAENRRAMNQERVEPVMKTGKYYLVSETGFLLVFCEDRSTVRLYTHVPITDFPGKEQDRLREGTWFTFMMDIYNYLESYIS